MPHEENQVYRAEPMLPSSQPSCAPCILRECHEKSMREAMGDVPETRGPENGERPSDCGAGPVDSKACPRLDMPGEVGIGLVRDPSRLPRSLWARQFSAARNAARLRLSLAKFDSGSGALRLRSDVVLLGFAASHQLGDQSSADGRLHVKSKRL